VVSATSFTVPCNNCFFLFIGNVCTTYVTVAAVQKRKSMTVSVEVKKTQHRYVIGPKGSGLTEILAATGVSVEIPPSDNVSETITLRGDPEKLGPALTMVYAKVC